MRIKRLRITPILIAVMFLAVAGKANAVSFKNAPDISGVSVQSIDGELYRPNGTGPFPAVVLLHSCGGLNDTDTNWAGFLKDLGYVALVVDTFGSRGEISCPVDFSGISAMISDAYGALDYLATLPYVDKTRFGVFGRSLGGNAIDRLANQKYKSPGGLNFKIGINMFGRCDTTNQAIYMDTVFKSGEHPISTLVIIGDRENPTRLFPCRNMAGKSPLVSVHILKDAYHAFDHDRRGSSFAHGENEMRYSGSATAKAEQIIKAYLAERLGK